MQGLCSTLIYVLLARFVPTSSVILTGLVRDTSVKDVYPIFVRTMNPSNCYSTQSLNSFLSQSELSLHPLTVFI